MERSNMGRIAPEQVSEDGTEVSCDCGDGSEDPEQLPEESAGLYCFRDEWFEFFMDAYADEEIEIYLWPEELLERKLIVYAGKFGNFSEYGDIREHVAAGAVIEVCSWLDMPLRYVSVKIDSTGGNVFISEDVFNKEWDQIKKNIKKIVNLAHREETPCCISKAEDIVDLSHLANGRRTPYLEKNRIKYRATELSEEERRLLSRRQSLLDNPKMVYFYASGGETYHDKNCEEIKSIPVQEFTASKVVPQGRKPCPRCRRTMYIRKGCAPNTRQIPVCDYIFSKNNIRTSQLCRFVERGMTFHADVTDEMVLHCTEDSWIIQGIDSGNLVLLHNNYVRISETERYITDGFHSQNMEGRKFLDMLYCIEGYTWERHLQGEAEKKAEKSEKAELEQAKVLSEANTNDPERETEANSPMQKDQTQTEGLIQRIGVWISALRNERIWRSGPR